MIDRLQYYDGLAKETLGREIKHTLLIHHNVLNALFLDDLIQAFKKANVKFIDARDAYRDPVFREQPDFLPAGESLIWMLAKKSRPERVDLRYPAEDGKYIDGDMDRLGL